jgi:hypothetical protein
MWSGSFNLSSLSATLSDSLAKAREELEGQLGEALAKAKDALDTTGAEEEGEGSAIEGEHAERRAKREPQSLPWHLATTDSPHSLRNHHLPGNAGAPDDAAAGPERQVRAALHASARCAPGNRERRCCCIAISMPS